MIRAAPARTKMIPAVLSRMRSLAGRDGHAREHPADELGGQVRVVAVAGDDAVGEDVGGQACTSSGVAYVRPDRAARALAARSRWTPPRGELPSRIAGSLRLAWRMAT